MNLPPDREIYRTDIAEFWFTDNGILCCNAGHAARSIENITRSFSLVEKITGGKRVCLLADLTNTGVQSKKERDFAMKMLPRYYKAMAILSHSDFGRSIANIFLLVYNLPLPLKIFKTEAEAQEWLEKFL
jgi:hypothetical protein